MKRPSGDRLTVRGLTSASLAALALLCLVVAGGVAWVATLLQSTSSTLVCNSESLRLATQIELQLLNYARLAALPGDEDARQDLREVEDDLETTLAAILKLSESRKETALIHRAVDDVMAYLSRRTELERGGSAGGEIRQGARPLLERALDSLTQLVSTDETAVAAAYARAQRVGGFFIAASVATVLLTGALLVLMTFAMRNLLLRPILSLRDTIDGFRSGKPLVKADERMPRELAEIGRAFNEMSEELERQKARELAFIAGVAHDLRNPLSALQFSLDAMKARRSTWDSETLHIFDLLGRQLDHLSRMVSDLLETCYIEAGKLTLSSATFDLRDAAKSVVDLYGATASERAIELELGSEPALVCADRTRIEQVVGNLLSNSIKYSSPGSRIKVGVSVESNDVELSVADEGVGIREEDRENIFRPFWRADEAAKRSGTGLGLSVVRKIVAAHEGAITVDSTPGKGSVFRVRLPRTAAAESMQAGAAS
ncbi:MAG TPA: HAMP domain-containing sensor histidine kinase [Gammaproteobacteria bacterium]|nr:HAMP domain-containing sensor histidine kinase [Gammaproteobacteria bacterium]